MAPWVLGSTYIKERPKKAAISTDYGNSNDTAQCPVSSLWARKREIKESTYFKSSALVWTPFSLEAAEVLRNTLEDTRTRYL
jgi:hypothetical protein